MLKHERFQRIRRTEAKHGKRPTSLSITHKFGTQMLLRA